jgi:hypothetical protein
MHAHAQFAQQAIDGIFVLELLVKVRVRVCIILCGVMLSVQQPSTDNTGRS